MPISKEWITDQILTFMAVASDCEKETNFANDRSVFADRVSFAMRWISSMRKGENPYVIAEDIIDSQTIKYFTDYMCGGEWEKRYSVAFSALHDNVKSKIKE